MKNSFIILGIGEILWDIFPDSRKLGGAPANFAFHAHQLGAEAYPVSRIGADFLGKEILETLKKLGLNRDLIQVDPAKPTGTVTVTIGADKKPSYMININTAWDFIDFDKKTAGKARQADAVCFGSLCQHSVKSRKTIIEILRTTKHDCIKIFDINLRQKFYSKKNISLSLQLSDVLKLNEDELSVLADLYGIKGSQSATLRKIFYSFKSIRLIALTRGHNGSILSTPSHIAVHKGFSARVVDTVGAGDAFTAALAMGMLKGDPLETINEAANRIGSFVCSRKGATPELPENLRKIFG